MTEKTKIVRYRGVNFHYVLPVETEQESPICNATIRQDLTCAQCGWPIVDACCNDSFCNFQDAAEWDWWYYCSNKGCKNHEGEGVSQNFPSWIKQVKP